MGVVDARPPRTAPDRRLWKGLVLAVIGLALFGGCLACSAPVEQNAPPPTMPAPAETPPPPRTPSATPSSPSARGRAQQGRGQPRDQSQQPQSQSPRPLELPAFEWPPPRYSAFVELPREWIFEDSATLGSVARRLEYAFDSAGYSERSYFWIPGGFALASRIEQIGVDATPLAPPARWAIRMTRPPQGFLDFVRALFDARPGLYRVIVFTVTDAGLSAGKRTPTPEEATEWIFGGVMQLPAGVGTLPYSAGHHTIALIYEFERVAEDSRVRVTQPSNSPGRVHLERSGLLQALALR